MLSLNLRHASKRGSGYLIFWWKKIRCKSKSVIMVVFRAKPWVCNQLAPSLRLLLLWKLMGPRKGCGHNLVATIKHFRGNTGNFREKSGNFMADDWLICCIVRSSSVIIMSYKPIIVFHGPRLHKGTMIKALICKFHFIWGVISDPCLTSMTF